MSETKLAAEPREAGHPHHIRREGKIPGVVYGHRRASQALAVDGREFYQVLSQGINTLIRLSLGAAEDTVMIKDLQRHPLTGRVTHIDFLAVALDELIKTTVPLVVSGEETATEGGGIVQHQLREVEVECLPMDVPGNFTVDISALSIGSHFTAGDLSLPAGVTLVTDPGELIVTIVAPRLAEEPAADAGEEPTEGEAPAEEPKL